MYVNGIYYKKIGKGPVLIFIHGLLSSSTFWIRQVEFFRRNYTCITVDLRGYGLSTRQGEISLNQFAKDIRAIMNKEKVVQAVLIGHSMGGVVAQVFAVNYPLRVKALVLSNTLRRIPNTSKVEMEINKIIINKKEFDEESWRSYLESVGAIIMKSPFIWRNRKLVSDLMQIEHDLNAGAKWLDSVRALLREEVKTEKIRHQSLVIASLLDPLLPLTMEVYNRLKNKELFVIANSGHQSPVERPTVWNKRVELFLKSI